MTPFDWSQLLAVAEDLASHSNDDAAARSAINRAHYAAFGMARRDLVSQGGAIQARGSAHPCVWTAFHAAPGRVNHRIANLGRRLLGFRRRADCDDLYPDLEVDATTAVTWARRILADLDSLAGQP